MIALFVIYLWALINTFSKIKLLGKGGLKVEEKALLQQFTIFAVAYITRGIWGIIIDTVDEGSARHDHLHAV